MGGDVAARHGIAAAPGTDHSTKLTVTKRSVARDSWVTFTAKVSSAHGVPGGGFVSFTDRSNGSILDKARVRKGKATFRTAALATGSRRIVAHYLGGAKYAKSTSAVLGVSVTQAGSLATAYQVDARMTAKDRTRCIKRADQEVEQNTKAAAAMPMSPIRSSRAAGSSSLSRTQLATVPSWR